MMLYAITNKTLKGISYVGNQFLLILKSLNSTVHVYNLIHTPKQNSDFWLN